MFDGRMSWSEAWSLAHRLLVDPTSHLHASVAEWDYPASHEYRALADIYDATVRIAAGKKHQNRIKPYSRPWSTKDKPVRSAKPRASQAIVREALRARGH